MEDDFAIDRIDYHLGDDAYMQAKEGMRPMLKGGDRLAAACEIDIDLESTRLDMSESHFRLQSRTARTMHRSKPAEGAFHCSRPSAYCWLVTLIFFSLIGPSNAVLISFENCLSAAYLNNVPTLLQFVPTFVDAVFNTTDTNHNLRLTVWGNVTGSSVVATLPPPDDPSWLNPNDTDGKIVNVTSPTNKVTTLFSKADFLSYEPWISSLSFCNQLVNGSCPLAPTFAANSSDPNNFHAFSVNNNFFSSYAFTSLTTTLLIINGDTEKTSLGCISAEITPDMGNGLRILVTYTPLVVLILVGIATAFAGIYSPWGTTDVFRWTSNYGRDADLLRLVTPGFGDCLQYIQFVALTGGLTLSYPGFYQPITSRVAWSALMFNESFVSGGNGSNSLVDGIYVTHGKYGLERLSHLVGMTDVDDIWAGMAVWLLVILGAIMVVIQIGFLLRWINRKFSGTLEEDLRAKNMPFSVGNIIRIVFSYLLLPIVTLSMFQLFEAGRSPAYTVALAAVLLLIVVGFAAWLLYVVASTRPRSFLFDDLPTVLLYGSLYNTYSDNAAPFALIPVVLTVIRGIVIGVVQPSGIAQLVLLAICEIITILTLHAFRPFHSPTSMNAYHTFFAICRCLSVMLMVAFAPSLGVTDGSKSWIGYAILLLHAIVLIFAFLLNAIQTIVEVGARLAGAGGDESGATRGGLVKVFGMRQLSRRLPRGEATSRQSQLSSSGMLGADQKSAHVANSGRGRSQSAGSTGVLLNRPGSMGLDSIDHTGTGAQTPTTPGDASMFSFLPTAAAAPLNRSRGTILNLSSTAAADPYYRPPRFRRPTGETTASPRAKSRGSWGSGDWANARWSQADTSTPIEASETLGPSVSGRATPVPTLHGGQQGIDAVASESRRSQTDYTTREVDFYYGVRGPALNANVPGRRLRTGPVDPTNNIASIGGFFRGLLGGKTKEKGKGFEVVRSSRMPPGMKARNVAGHESPPEGIPVASGGARNGPIDSDDDEPVNVRGQETSITPEQPILDRSNSDLGSEIEGDEEEFEMTRISEVPPSLPRIDSGDSFELPSRLGSMASSRPTRQGSNYSGPSVPRKSSRRISRNLAIIPSQGQQLDDAEVSPVSPIETRGGLYDPQVSHKPRLSTDSSRLPFERTNSDKRQSTISTRSSILAPASADTNDRPTSVGHVNNHNVRTVNPEHFTDVDLLGRSAEIVNERRGSSTGPLSFEDVR
ncbi:MAG: hypothetical protein M1818_003413 [Claussenomyces sp. TS43310]|nr:MAG: hypothetical protein M1818_003413 [Claussenomyces sp. TS43310]